MEETRTIRLPALDAERDIIPSVVVVEDYNGEPIVHVFVTGERIVRMIPNENWKFEFTPPTTTEERQAHAALAYHTGEMTEDQDQRLADVWGKGDLELIVFHEVMDEPADECRQVVAWVGTVAHAVYEAIGQDYGLLEPTGW